MNTINQWQTLRCIASRMTSMQLGQRRSIKRPGNSNRSPSTVLMLTPGLARKYFENVQNVVTKNGWFALKNQSRNSAMSSPAWCLEAVSRRQPPRDEACGVQHLTGESSWPWKMRCSHDTLQQTNANTEKPWFPHVGVSRMFTNQQKWGCWPSRRWWCEHKYIYIWCRWSKKKCFLHVIPTLKHYSDIVSDIPFWKYIWHIHSDILSNILSGIYMHILWHSIWDFIWHLFWHSFWHSIWHSLWRLAEVRQRPQRSGARGSGPAVPTAVCSSRLRSWKTRRRRRRRTGCTSDKI